MSPAMILNQYNRRRHRDAASTSALNDFLLGLICISLPDPTIYTVRVECLTSV